MDRILHLPDILQITDSFFPSGSFAYSWGLETYVTEGIISDISGLNGFLNACLKGMIGNCDALVLKLSLEAAERDDMETVIRLDRLIHSMKSAKETREGSIQTGRQLLKVIRQLHKSVILDAFQQSIGQGNAFGHQPVVFALVCRHFGISRDDAVPAFLYSLVSSIVSAGVRLIPLGHTDGQRAIVGVKSLLAAITNDISRLDEDDISAFAPGIEIRAMRHEHLYTRLFKS